MKPAERLARGLCALGFDLPFDARQRLLEYCALLQKWNRVYNLTAVRDEDRIVTHHLLDALAVLPHLRGASLVDIGSGGGFPGIPLALARPEWRVTLVEANQKKASFLRQAAIELRLSNVSVQNVRAEAWSPETGFDIVISRALTDLAQFVRLSQHLLGPGGRLYAMKGVCPHEEMARLPAGCAVEGVIALQIPHIASPRHLLILVPRTA